MAEFAKEYDLVADTDAYADVFDMVTLKAAKATLDAAFAKDAVLSKMQAVVDAWKVLEVAADEAQWREYVYVDSTLLKPEKDTDNDFTVEVKLADGTVMYAKVAVAPAPNTSDYALLSDKDFKGAAATNKGAYTAAFTLEDGATYWKNPNTKFYATEKDAVEDGVKKTAKIEITLKVDNGTAPVDFADYQLALKAAVETAVKVRDALLDDYPNPDSATSELKTKYGYGKTTDEPVKEAVDAITKVELFYYYSVVRAQALYTASLKQGFMNTQTNVELDKKDTYGDYSLQAEFDKLGKKLGGQTKVTENLALIDSAINAAIKTFTAQDEESGTTYTLNSYVKTGTNYVTGTGEKFNLVNGVPTIRYKAWTYRWEIEKDNISNAKNKHLEATTTEFDALRTLVDSDANAVIAKTALRWLAKYIGTEDYAESYNLYEYKDYNKIGAVTYPAFAKTDILYMTDRDITEVAVPVVVKTRAGAVDVAKNDTDLGAKLLSPYTVAKALVAEEEKIVAAKEEAIKDLSDAALALRTAGDASAIAAVNHLQNQITSGEYVDAKLGYELDFDNVYGGKLYTTGDEAYIAYVSVSLTGAKVVVQEKPEVKVLLTDLINDANNALTAARTAFTNIENTRAGIDPEYITFASLLAQQSTINGTTGLKARIADNTAFSTLFQNYVEQATAAVSIATAGQAANVIKTEGVDSVNDNEKTANEKLARVQAIQNILSNYGTFESAYVQDATNYLGYAVAALAGSVSAADFSNYVDKAGSYIFDYVPAGVGMGFLDAYWNKVTVSVKENIALAYRLAAIVNASAVGTYSGITTIAPATSSEDSVRLKAALTTAEEAFNEDLAAYKLGVKASDALANSGFITAANAGITDFADNNIADYVNLKVAHKLGDDTVEMDYFTETYKAIIMANSQKVITNVMAYTTSLETANSLAAGSIYSKLAGDNWVNGVTSRVNKLAVKFDAVTGKKAGDALVKSYEFSDATYSLEYALEQINDVLKANSKPEITLRDLRNAAY